MSNVRPTEEDICLETARRCYAGCVGADADEESATIINRMAELIHAALASFLFGRDQNTTTE